MRRTKAQLEEAVNMLSEEIGNLVAKNNRLETQIEQLTNLKSTKGTDLDVTLAERGTRYGHFSHHAALSQRLKRAMSAHSKYLAMSPVHKEALEMIAHKMARIVNGDPNYKDSWVDIAGYAKLGEQACEGEDQ